MGAVGHKQNRVQPLRIWREVGIYYLYQLLGIIWVIKKKKRNKFNNLQPIEPFSYQGLQLSWSSSPPSPSPSFLPLLSLLSLWWGAGTRTRLLLLERWKLPLKNIGSLTRRRLFLKNPKIATKIKIIMILPTIIWGHHTTSEIKSNNLKDSLVRCSLGKPVNPKSDVFWQRPNQPDDDMMPGRDHLRQVAGHHWELF